MHLLRLLPLLCALVPAACSYSRQHAFPTETRLLLDRLVVASDVKVAAGDPLLAELISLQGQLSSQLGLRNSNEPIYVYLFQTRKALAAYSRRHFPLMEGRRAYFVENSEGLNVFAYWGERVAEDLRHEVTHGYLHSAAPQIPLWLDEGIAEYYEVAAGGAGINWAHVERLTKAYRQEGWRPDLLRLERLVDAAAMSQLEYAESWLWVHFCLETQPVRAASFRQYLAQLQEDQVQQTFTELLEEPASRALGHLQFLIGEDL